MQCFKPLQGYRARNQAGEDKSQVIFYDPGNHDPVEIRCGNCIGCRLTKARHWALRCVHEAQLHEQNSFITLTYAPEHLPENQDLRFKDTQLFLHRLRKHCARKHDKKIRFFLCGEYGNDTTQYNAIGRPHYHAIIFGYDFAEDRVCIEDKADQDKRYYSQTLEDLWGLGRTDLGLLTLQSAAYVAQYTVKKINGQMASEHYLRLDPETAEVTPITPEQSRQSRRPGIGRDWYTKYGRDLEKGFITLNGKKESIPKFYERIMEDDRAYALEQIREDKLKRLTAVKQVSLDAQHRAQLERTKDIGR